jgi:hypothetical protein
MGWMIEMGLVFVKLIVSILLIVMSYRAAVYGQTNGTGGDRAEFLS